MDMGISEFAANKGISSRRVLQLIHKGDVKAHKISNRWIINPVELAVSPKVSRPLSPKMSLAMLELLSGQKFSNRLDPAEIRRLDIRLAELKKHEDPASLLRSWIKFDCEPIELSVHNNDMEKLRHSPILIPSGASHPSSGMSDGNIFEAYVEKKNYKKVQREFLLVPSEKPNVILKVINEPFPHDLMRAIVMSDLAANNGPRERNMVKEMIQKL